MSSPKNFFREGRSPSAKIQLDVEETMPQPPKAMIPGSLQYTNTNSNLSLSNSNASSPASRRSSSFSEKNFMDVEVIPSIHKQQEQEKELIIPDNKCKVKGHKREDLIFVCTIKECDEVLMCKRCKRKHKKEHQGSIKLLDDWFNKMFGRRVEDSDNNKVSRKCGMNIGKLQEQLRTYQAQIDARKETIEKQTQQFIEMITSYIKQKHNECIKRLDGHFQAKNQLLDEYQQTYKKLKGLNRFTILENLKRQHNPNSEQPPLIPIQSIIRFLLENEKQYSDSQQIENQHKGFSKLIRDTDSLEQAINNEAKQLTKLASTDEGKPDYLIRDSPIIQRMQDYIDFLYYFEKGIPKKTQSFFRSGTLNFDEEDYSSQLNSAGNNTNNVSSINLSFTNQCQRMQSSKPIPGSAYRKFLANANSGETTNRRRLTAEEVLKYSRPSDQPQANMLKQIQQQDEGDFIIQKQKEQKLQNNGKYDGVSDDEEKEEVEYECLVQENFNNATFIDFKSDSIRVFGDQSVQLYEINGAMFNKKDNLKAQQQIISHDQEMYEIGAIEEVYFFQNPDSLINGMPLSSARGFECLKQIGSGSLRNDSILADDDASFHLLDLNQTAHLSSNSFTKKLPILIIGLKSDPAKIEIWDMNTNEKIFQYLQAHDCSITCIQILEVVHNKSILFAVGSYDGIIKTWLFTCSQPESPIILNGLENANTSALPTYTLTQQLIMKCHTDFVTNMILFKIKDNPQKEYLISAGSDKKMILWNWKTEDTINDTPITEIPSSNPSLSPLPAEKDAIAEGKAKTITSEEQKQSPVEEVKKKPPFLKKQIKLMSFTKNSIVSSSSTLASEQNSGQNKAANEKAMRKPLKVMENVHQDKINCFEKLDEGFLATGSSDNTIKIWDMDTQVEQKVLQNKYIVNNVCRLKRGTLICSANNVKMGIYLINIWNWESGKIIGTIKGHTNRITKIHVIPNLFGESCSEPIYSKIITCERNKVIRIWKQTNVDTEFDRPINSQEDEIVNSPSSIRSHVSRAYGYNPAEEFLNMYHLEMDPSLTPKLNMARITSSTNLSQGPHDKTPISNLIRGAALNGQTTPSNSNLYFSSSSNQQARHQFNPTFSQQNNLLQQQYFQIAQQVQQSNNGQVGLIKQNSLTNYTPPKNNQTFKFSLDEQQQQQQQMNFSPLQQSPLKASLGSPQIQSKNGKVQSIPLLQISSTQIQQNQLGNSCMNIANQGSLFVPTAEHITIPINNTIISNSVFQQQQGHVVFQQQQGSVQQDLQKVIEQVVITHVDKNNDLEQSDINVLPPSIDLITSKEAQQIFEQQLQEQLIPRKRNFSEIGHVLTPLEEANESEYNSPVESQKDVCNPNDHLHSFVIDSSKFSRYSRTNSNDSCEISIYQPSPTQKESINGNCQINPRPQSKIFHHCGPFSQIIERSPGSESSGSSGNYSEHGSWLNREGSSSSNDSILQHRNSISSSSPNSSDYPHDNNIEGLNNQLKIKTSQSEDNSPSKELTKFPVNYSIKLNGVQKHGSLEVNGTPSENGVQTNISNPHSLLLNNSQTNPEDKNENKMLANLNSQNSAVENIELLKVDNEQENQFSSATLLPPDDKKASSFSQSAPTSPSLVTNPLLKNKGALQKTKKSSRNIFQN